MLSAAVKEVQGLVRDLLRREAQGQCGSCGRGEDRVQLEQEVHRALEAVDKLNIELNDTKDKLKGKVRCCGYFCLVYLLVYRVLYHLMRIFLCFFVFLLISVTLFVFV